MATKDDLMGAFAGESQANRKYLAFSKKAEEEGFRQVAKLFRAAADAETVHAMAHLRAVGGVKTTKENLKEAVSGETHEFTEMYPGMIKRAENEKNSAATTSFILANKVEQVHARLYNDALKAVADGNDLKKSDIHVCQVCGYTVEGEAPDNCPVCGAPKGKFKGIE